MVSYNTLITAGSSTALRVLSLVFLRWIPGHQAPPAIFALAAVYLVSYIIEFASTSPYNIVEDDIVIVDRFLPAREAAALGVPTGTEEIDIAETIVAEEKPPHVFSTLLSGLPSPTSLLASLATLLVNLALVGMVLDLTYRSHIFWPEHDLKFARLGYVAEDSARILVREPDVKQLPIFLSVRYADAPLSTGTGNRALDSAWRAAGSTEWLTEDTDFTTTFTIRHLLPDTRYQYALSNNVSGYFVTAPPVGQVSQRRDAHKTFSFMHTSCIKPRFPYDPREHPLAITGFKHLSKWIGTLRPSFMMFLGDFIYVDVPQRHGKDVETYRRGYRQVYGSPDWPAVSSTRWTSTHGPDYDIPWLHVYDDHEIANDWDANVTGYYASAFDPYQHYHLSVNPPLFLETSVTPKDLAMDKSLPTWMVFNQGPASFFVLDTRRYRDSNNHAASDPDASMLGKAQLISLLTWLSAPVPAGVHWKIVITSVPFTKNWRVNAADTWGNYLVERQRILEAMWTATTVSGIGIVILSGDRHEFAATAFPPPVDDDRWLPQASVHEFSASPLNMFYIPYSSYQQTDLEDVCIKYIRDGNSKFGYVEIGQPTLSGQSILTYRLFVDGEEAWSHVLVSAGGIDGAIQMRRGYSGHRPGAIQWIKEEGKWMQHELEDAEHWVADKAHSAGNRLKHGAQTAERWAAEETHAVKDNVRSSVRAGEHYIDDTARTVSSKAHYAEQAALGGLFAGWNWFGNKAKAAEHTVQSEAAAASNYAHKNVDHARSAASNVKDEIIDEARHASYNAVHGAKAATSNVKTSAHKVEDYASRQTDNVKHQIHENADRMRSAAAHVEHEVADEARRVARGAQAVTSSVKDGVHRAENFATRQTDQVKSSIHKGADRVRKVEESVKSEIVDDALHASHHVVHGAQAVTSSVKEGVRKAESFATKQTDNAKLQAHKGADYIREGVHGAKDAIVDEAHHASYRVAHGASDVAHSIKSGAAEVSEFASRQAHAGSYTVSSISSRVGAGIKAGEHLAAEKARAAAEAVKLGEQKVEQVIKGAGHAAASSARAAADAAKKGEQKVVSAVDSTGRAAVDAARRGEQKVEQNVKSAAHQAALSVRNAEQAAEQAAKQAARQAASPLHAAGSAISKGEEYIVDEITSAGAAATQAGKHVVHDAAHAGHHIAQDLKSAGQHVKEDVKEFGGHVKEDLKEAVPAHHRARQVVHEEEVVEGIRRKAIGTEDFLMNTAQTMVSVASSVILEGTRTMKSGVESVVTSMSQAASGDDGWHRRDVEEAAAAGVAGVAAMNGIAP